MHLLYNIRYYVYHPKLQNDFQKILMDSLFFLKHDHYDLLNTQLMLMVSFHHNMINKVYNKRNFLLIS